VSATVEAARGLVVGELRAVPPAGHVIGVGIDAVDIDRFRRVLERRPRLADRLFTPAELSYARKTKDPVARLSTRFAAKEAAMKALGVGLGAFPFAAAEVVRAGVDKPSLVLHGTASAVAEGEGVTGWHLSLTHTDRVALAVAVAVGEGGAAGAVGEGGAAGAVGAGSSAGNG
jgi:holo-[acyl-carrier protein] synthase